VGEVVTADNINTYYQGLTFAQNPPICVMYTTVTQTVATGTLTPLVFNANYVDTYGGHSLITNTSRYTSQVAGYYLASGQAALNASTAGTFRFVAWYVNGSPVPPGGALYSPPPISTGIMAALPTILIHLNVNDYLEAYFEHNTGANYTMSFIASDQQSYVSIEWAHV